MITEEHRAAGKEFFKRIDADNNGIITKAEADAARSKGAEKFKERAEERFAEKDTNKNGKLERSEVARMPDERTYFWVARTTTTEPNRYLGPDRSFAIGLGCDVAHAEKLIYSVGIDPTNAESIVPIGAGCKICDRPACPQRAFPYLGRPVYVDPHSSTDLPYPPVITG